VVRNRNKARHRSCGRCLRRYILGMRVLGDLWFSVFLGGLLLVWQRASGNEERIYTVGYCLAACVFLLVALFISYGAGVSFKEGLLTDIPGWSGRFTHILWAMFGAAGASIIIDVIVSRKKYNK